MPSLNLLLLAQPGNVAKQAMHTAKGKKEMALREAFIELKKLQSI
ncbi:MAG: hypothetical protein V4739_06440 [Pseudomonadota bacterium]